MHPNDRGKIDSKTASDDATVREQRPEPGGPHQPSPDPGRADAAIDLLEGWLVEPRDDDDDARLAAFIKCLDEDRLSDRKLFS